MIQQINLYQEEFRVIHHRINLSLLGGVALVLLVLVGSSFYQMLIVNDLETELNSKNNELKSLEQSYAALEKAVQPRAMDMNLAESVEKARRSNQEKLRAKNYLSGDGVGNITGFSSLLQGLGRQRDEIEELWLKNIKFSDGGFEMRLVGSNYRPELLPGFIQALKDEELYRDREFREIRISRSTLDNKTMDFVLGTRNKGDDSDNDANKSDRTLFMARLKRVTEEKVSR